ncbi:MAG: hypothetical protein JW776_12480 [Candidatus Lokiarchaeota archaeon]|nr:hypothetical protein [Candidatus Lokiarchaeota archaeon]
MNEIKRITRKIIFLTSILLVICTIFSTQTTDKFVKPSFYYNEQETPNSSIFEGSARRFQVTQHATAISSTYEVNPTTSASFTLSSGWTANNLLIECENVTRYRNLVIDGRVNSGGDYGTPYTYWDYNELDSGSDSLNPDYRADILSLDVGDEALTAGDYAYYNQSVTVDEEDVGDRIVEFTFDYRIRDNNGAYNTAYLYAAIIIGGVEYNQTYGFGTLNYDYFYSNSIQYYLSNNPIGNQTLPNDVEFRLGVYINGDASYRGSPNDVHFDYIEYNIWTLVDEPNILTARDIDDSTVYYYQNSTPGMGNFTINVQKNYPVTQDVSFTISDSIYDTILIDKLTISANLTQSINSSFSTFQDGIFTNSNDILWEFDVSPLIPVTYLYRWIEIEKPEDWQIISAVDPFLTNRTSICTDIGYGTTDFTIPTSVYSNGDWQIQARSKSWFDEVKLEFWNGVSFEEKSDFYVNEEFHIRVNINNTVIFTNTLINFTLYHPNGTIFYEESFEPSSTEIYYGNFTIGTFNMSIGMYTAEVAWTNNLSASYVDKVGYRTFDFSVIHHTQLTAQDSIIETVPGEPLLIIVKYEDTDTGQGIDLATVEYNSTFEQTGYLQYIGSGYYFLDLDTSLLDYTDYYLSFNASKSYYINQTASNMVQLNIEREGMILEVPRQVNIVSANSYGLFEFNLTGDISEAYLHPANISTDWMAPYEITNYNNGSYQLNVSTYGVTSGSFPETFIINIEANKTNYSVASDIVLLQVNPIQSIIKANATFIEISQGTPFSVKVNYTDTGLGTLIVNASCSVTWTLDTNITVIGDEFIIDYDTTGLALDQYTSFINLNKSGYETKSIIISVLINPVQTAIAANRTFIRVSQGNQFSIKVNYTEYYGGAIISGATCSVTWVKYYEITPVTDGFEILFNTTDLTLDQYTATIQLNKTGFETKNVFITVLVDPISTVIEGNVNLITIEQGEIFSIKVNYTYFDTGTLISGASCIVTWLKNSNITELNDEFFIDFDTTGLDLGQYTVIIQISRLGFETRSLFVTVLIEPVSSELFLLNDEPVEFFVGDQVTISVDYRVNGLSFSGGTITLIGDIEGTLMWNGTAYTMDFDTSDLQPKIYFSQIFAQAPGVQTQIYNLYIQIQPVVFEVTLSSSSIILSEGGSNMVYITVYDSSHGVYVTDANISSYIDGIAGNIISLENGTYSINLDQFGLNPGINPYSLHIGITNPNGEDESFLITVVVPQNWNLYWWIAGSVAGTALLGVMSLLIYNRYIKLSKFQRNVSFIKKNLLNLPKIKNRTEFTRDALVSDIINKEIDQLL